MGTAVPARFLTTETERNVPDLPGAPTVRLLVLACLPLPVALVRSPRATMLVVSSRLTRRQARDAMHDRLHPAERLVIANAYGHAAWPHDEQPDDHLPVPVLVPPSLSLFDVQSPYENGTPDVLSSADN